VEINQTSTFFGKIAQHRICRHTGGIQSPVHLHLTNWDKWQQYWYHISQECHCGTRWCCGCPSVRNWEFGTWIYVYTQFFPPHAMFQSCCICEESQAWHRLYSRFAEWWRNIYWLAHYPLYGNAADIQFADNRSPLT
jgi:hypothetical protein